MSVFSLWTGTGTVVSSGDSEKIGLMSGQYMESPPVNTGALTVTLAVDAYGSGDGHSTLKYRTAAAAGDLSGEGWTTYSAPFESAGYVGLRLEEA